MQPQQPYPPQGYPQQGYAPQPQQQPYGPPQGQPYPQQPQYAPQPSGPTAPAPGYGGPHPLGPDGISNPDPSGGSIIRPRLTDIGVGRLLLITPIRIERDVPNRLADPDPQTGKLPVQDRLTVDLVVLDGAPFMYGGQPENGRPHHLTAQVPYESLGMWISNGPLISQLERSLGGGKVLGRLTQVPSTKPGRRPVWKLDNATDADRATAQAFLAAKLAGNIAPPQQVPAPQPYMPQPTYPTQATPQWVPPQQQFDGGYQPAAAPGAEQPWPAQGPQYQPQYAPPPPVAQGNWPQGQPVATAQPGAALAAPPAAQVDINTPAPGYSPEQWASMPVEQRQMVAASLQGRPGY